MPLRFLDVCGVFLAFNYFCKKLRQMWLTVLNTVMYLYKVFAFNIAWKVSYSEFFWSVFSRIRTEYGQTRSIFSHSPRMRENADQKSLCTGTLHAMCSSSEMCYFTASLCNSNCINYKPKSVLKWPKSVLKVSKSVLFKKTKVRKFRRNSREYGTKNLLTELVFRRAVDSGNFEYIHNINSRYRRRQNKNFLHCRLNVRA